MLRKKGQGTLEYVVILSAIIAALLAGRTILGGGVQSSVQSATNSITNAASRLPGAN